MGNCCFLWWDLRNLRVGWLRIWVNKVNEKLWLIQPHFSNNWSDFKKKMTGVGFEPTHTFVYQNSQIWETLESGALDRSAILPGAVQSAPVLVIVITPNIINWWRENCAAIQFLFSSWSFNQKGSKLHRGVFFFRTFTIFLVNWRHVTFHIQDQLMAGPRYV